MRMWRSTRALALPGLTALNFLATVILGTTAHGTGLHARYFATPDWSGPQRLDTVDRWLNTRLLEQRGAEIGGGESLSVEWTGFLYVPTSHVYDIATTSDDGSFVYLDDDLIVDNGGEHGALRVAGRKFLERGPHRLRIRYFDAGLARIFDFQWSDTQSALQTIPAHLLSTTRPDPVTASIRLRLPELARVLLVLWYVPILWLTLLAATRVARWLWPADTGASVRALSFVMMGAAALFLVGIWWGVPDYRGWAPDEVTPLDAILAGERWFADGWASMYPPVHYFLLNIWTLPFLLFERLGLLERMDPPIYGLMFLAQRLLSVLMALSIVAIVYGIAREIKGTRAGVLAALVFVGTLPLTYYAKVTNADVPYVFWFTLSMLFYVRVLRHSKPIDFCLFALTGMIAVCTKDQAYGFYVLPAAYMATMTVWYVIRRQSPSPMRGVPTLRVLMAMGLITIVTFAIGQNLPFNLSGFHRHLDMIMGPRSQEYRMYAPTIDGQARLLGAALVEIALAMSWPLAVAALCGTIVALWRGPRAMRWLLLPAASYYICLIAVVGYLYDRFFLGVIVILAIVTGAWLAEWSVTTARRAIVAVAIVYACARAVSLDAMMIRDARYDAEHWLLAQLKPDTSVAAVGLPEYLPRWMVINWMAIPPDLPGLAKLKPDYVIVNVLFATRETTGSRHEFYQQLVNGTAGYRRVLHCRTSLPLSALNYESRFQGTYEDKFSNLTKINPPIEIYERADYQSLR
jgi:hypothetical protein